MGSVCKVPIDSIIKQRCDNMRSITDVQRLVREVRQAMDTRSTKEIRLMTEKNEKMKKAINELVYENAKSLRILESMHSELKRDGLCVIKQGDSEHRRANLEKKCVLAEEKGAKQVIQKERLEKIIDLCKINKDVNEEWMRQLNFLINNMSKLSKRTQDKINKTNQEIAEIQKICNSLQTEQLTKQNEVLKMTKEISNNMKLQHDLDVAFMSNYSYYMEDPMQHRDIQKFADKLSVNHSKIVAPKVQSTKKEKASEKNYYNLYKETETDIRTMAELLGMSEDELLKTQGEVLSHPKFLSRKL